MNNKVSIHIATKDRHSEVSCLLTSLRNQTYQDWDIVIYDESMTPLTHHFPTTALLNRLKQENHKVKLVIGNERKGVCNARNKCIEHDNFENRYTCRVDDDVILDNDYLEKLLNVIEQGYDIASGITPDLGSPFIVGRTEKLKGRVNKLVFDEEYNITEFGDDCGMCWDSNKILPADHFRSSALYKSELNELGYETNLSPVGFREESFFSMKARYIKNLKIGVDLSAKALHFRTPSGGCRHEKYREFVNQDNELFNKWFKKIVKKYGEDDR